MKKVDTHKVQAIVFFYVIMKKFVEKNLNIQCTRLKDCLDEK